MAIVYDPEAFRERVAFAARHIAAGRPCTRTFCTCFEMQDGDAVAAALVRRVEANPHTALARNIWRYLGEPARDAAARLAGRNLDDAAREQRARARAEFDAFMARRT